MPRRRFGGVAFGLTLVVAGACDALGPPTWSGEVAEIVYAECAQCHRPQGPAPFSLLRYESASRRAADIAEMVSERRMPPWLPPGDGPHLRGERRLSERQIERLVAWAAAGAPEGRAGRAPEPPRWPTGWMLGEPDLVVQSGPSFPVPAEGEEIFRNLVLPVDIDRPRWVRAVELRPGDARVVHHATVRVDPTSSSRLEDARDSLPGFDNMFARTEARPPGGFFLGWTPGLVPTPFPDGMAWRLEPGSDFVVQLHLRPTGSPVEASVALGLHFTDEPPDEVPVIVRLGGQTMDIAPGEPAYEVVDSFRLPVAVDALGVYPHAHYLGRSMAAWARTPAGDSVALLDIPRWDFNWQDVYAYAEPVHLPAESTVRIRYVYDNSVANPLNPSDPPVRVVYGPTSRDEMAELWLQVVPSSPDELITLARAVAAKDLGDRMAGWRFLLEIDPDDAEAHFALGARAQAEGRLDDALAAYRRALEARPDYAQAIHNTGLIQEERGDPAAALRSYRQAVAALPTYPTAWNNLGRLLAAEGRRAEARAAFERALALDPRSVEARNNLGNALREEGETEAAEREYARAIELAPDFAPARFNRALTLVALGRAEDALLELNRGLALDGGNVQAALAVGWAMATHPDPAARRPDLAVDLGRQIREAIGSHPTVLDVLAAAYAASGRFEEAAALADQAVAEARGRGEEGRVPELLARRDLYRAGRAYVQPGR